MVKFNQRYFLVWRDVPCLWGTLPAGRQEIAKDEWHTNVDREEFSLEQAVMLNSIYGAGTHWIETSEGEIVTQTQEMVIES